MDVPEMVSMELGLGIHADVISEPGAMMFAHGPQLEKAVMQ